MKTVKKECILFLSILLFLIPFSGAQILIAQPESLYNLGDDFHISITLNYGSAVSDFLIAELVCDRDEIEIYKSPQSVSPGEDKQVTIEARLDTFLVQGTQGDCYIKASFAGEKATSAHFEVTPEIDVTLDIEGILFDPSAEVTVEGETSKANGKPVEGFVEITVPDIDFEFTGPVDNGKFNVSFRVPENSPAGSYELLAKVYEKDLADKITNEGSASAMIRIRQIIKELDIALNVQEVSPKGELTYSVILYDQAREHVAGDISVKVYKPEGSLFDQKIIRSDESLKVPLTQTSPPGYWKIEAKYEDLQKTKQFLVSESRDLSFTLIGQSLILENVGNVPYTGPVEIAIGDTREIKEIKDLPIGESIKYDLKAPDGEYTIEVGKGAEKQNLGTAFLTGRAISVKGEGENGIILTSLWVLGALILLLAIALGIVYVYKRLLHGKSISKSSSSTPSLKSSNPILANAIAQKAKEENQNIIDKGVKQDSTIISLHLKNYTDLQANDEALKVIDSALWKAKEVAAKIYSDGEYRIMIFAPVLTKEKENELKAVNVARSIERILISYNRRSARKIEFGLGINSGTLIVESSQDKFRFMSLNNIIATTKRISETSHDETLISETVKNRLLGKVKTLKLPDKGLWKIERVVDRSAYSGHIHSLTKRHEAHHSANRSVHHKK